MRRTLLVSILLVLWGCGGPPRVENYSLVVDYFRPLASCYADGTAPVGGVKETAPTLIQVQVWNGPAEESFLEIQKGGTTMDMGDAPGVIVGGVFTGTKASSGWVFKSETVEVSEVANATVSETKNATLAFARATTFTGTLALSSSRTCTSGTCPGLPLSCTISDLPFSGTQTPGP